MSLLPTRLRERPILPMKPAPDAPLAREPAVPPAAPPPERTEVVVDVVAPPKEMLPEAPPEEPAPAAEAPAAPPNETDDIEVDTTAVAPPPSAPPTDAPGPAAAHEILVVMDAPAAPAAPPAPTDVASWTSAEDMALAHNSKQLKEMAARCGVAQNGKKVEICERILMAQAASPGAAAE